MWNKNEIKAVFPFLIVFGILTWLVSGNSFFWDTIQLGSKQAHWFYENNFRYLFLPVEIDSGHPPVFGMYLALCWKIFGKTLEVSHWAMFPFIAGIVFQSRRLLIRFVDEKHILPAMLLFLSDCTLLAQFTLVSPDIVLLFFLLLSLNLLLKNKNTGLIFALMGLSLISMRGMMAMVAVFIIQLFINYNHSEFKLKRAVFLHLMPFYLLAAIPAVLFLILHYLVKGWIGYHPASSWASSFKIAGFTDIVKNVLILGWRLIDFGRLFLWIFLIVFLIKLIGKKLWDTQMTLLVVIFSAFLLVILPSFLLYKNLSLHRYLLPVLMAVTLFVIYLLFQKTKPGTIRILIYFVLISGLLTGNAWKYPGGIATGWDATLGHLPYYQLRRQMIRYLDEQKIPINQTGSAFPNISKLKYTDLLNNENCFKEKNTATDSFIVQSNIFNDFSNNELAELHDNFQLKKEFRSFGIYIRLFERKKGKEAAN